MSFSVFPVSPDLRGVSSRSGNICISISISWNVPRLLCNIFREMFLCSWIGYHPGWHTLGTAGVLALSSGTISCLNRLCGHAVNERSHKIIYNKTVGIVYPVIFTTGIKTFDMKELYLLINIFPLYASNL